MLSIRLFRIGKKNQPVFKIVVTKKTNPPRGGRFLEEVGYYNPVVKTKKLNLDRIKYWMSVGAKPSDTVYNLLVTEKAIEGKKIPSHKIVKGKAEEKPGPVAAVQQKKEVKEVLEEKAKEEKPAESK